jgi:uncharacterized membrane protein YfcA
MGSLLSVALKAADINFNAFIKLALGVALCWIALLLLISFLFDVASIKERIHKFIRAEKYPRFWLAAVGAFGGFVVGLTSVGSGTIMMACILVISNTSLRKLIGSDIVHATILLWTASIANLFVGHIDWLVVGFLLIGSIPGILLGSRLSLYAPKKLLKVLLIALLVFFGVKMLGI